MKRDSNTVILVPARMASTRFPGKLLHKINGRSLITHVGERIRSQAPEIPLVFAVDSLDLEKELSAHRFDSMMTSQEHVSGTDRLAEANRRIEARYVINIQGDEPLVTRDQIMKLAELVRGKASMGTLATVFVNPEDFSDPNQVKVVLNRDGYALYFSRSPLPYFRDLKGSPSENDLVHHLCYHHLGMYSYRADFLEKFSSLPHGRLEQLEKLEQLRALENGYPVAVGITSDVSIGVDTPEDADQLESIL